MFSNLLSPSRSLLLSGLVATSWALFSAGTVQAQGVNTYIPPDAKGYRSFQMRQAMVQEASRLAALTASATHPVAVYHSATTPPTEVHVAINIPGSWNPPAAVAIEGTDGEVRTFAVEGGREALHSRVIVVRPGERVTVQLTPARPRSGR
ncbi:MAG: hypothetical protein JWO38_5431 [Gemmataceae bacterium]|nr:hypothetical protein [Gemmataceae bacterium]